MAELPLVSIIILNYNGLRFVERCIRSVLSTDYPNFEVIFVDNKSTDGSPELVEKLFGEEKRLKIVKNEKNLGFSGGNNRGIRIARGDYIVLLNNDTEVRPDWLKQIIAVMEKRDDIGIAQPVILYMDSDNIIQTLGNNIDSILMVVKSVGKGKKFPAEKLCKMIKTSFPMGACIVLKRSLLKKIGLFDEKFFIYHDDIYWGLLTWLSGHKVATILTSVIYHYGRATIGRFKFKKIAYYNTISRLALILKIYNKLDIFVGLPSFIVLWYAYIAYKAMKMRAPKAILSVLKGYIWTIKNINHIIKERMKIKKRITKPCYSKFKKILLPNPFCYKKIETILLKKIGIKN